MISYLSLGTNLGDRQTNLLRAMELINNMAGPVIKQSSIIETDPVGFVSAHRFLNVCIAIETKLTPQELLLATQKIEKKLGREKKSRLQQYQDRLIDIDILLYGNIVVDEENLQIPHPRMQDREFVMKPLKEIMQ